jgi:hypothetical protein
MTGKLIVAFPLYKNLSAAFFTGWLGMDQSPIIGWVATNGVYVEEAMENLRDDAMSNFGEWDRLVIVEHDMLAPPQAFRTIADYPDDFDIVGPLYFGHRPPHHAMAWMECSDQAGYRPLTPEAVREMALRPAAYPVDSVGFGFTSIHRRVFEKWDDGPMFTAVPPLISHDLSFCKRAREQGFGVWIDSSLVCGHLKESLITIENNQSASPTNEDFSQRR